MRFRYLAVPYRSLIAVAALAMPAAAQGTAVVRGRVTLPDGATRAAGVIVVAVGGDSAPARTLTNTRGEYLLRVRAPGRYAMRALRVGFQPSTGPTVHVTPNDTVDAPIVLTGVAVSLSAVTVRGEDVCRTSPDSGALVAKAWEEARKAIMSSQLASSDAPLVAEWIEYNRTLDATARIVREQHVRTTRSPTTHAFKSVPAESLATRGYVTLDNGETTFHAPDGDALLSDSFAATHCFQIVQPPRGSEGLVGVGFHPTRERRDMREIEGTFWLDRQTAELRVLDFAYVNLPAATERANPGGRVEFLRTGTGTWLIGNWRIRMPILTRALPRSNTTGRVTVQTAAGTVLSGVSINGGQVVRVSRGDTAVYERLGATLDVQLVSADRLAGVAGGTVELDGTDYAGVADQAGRVRVSPVLDGRYAGRIRTPMMDSLDVPSTRREFEVGGGGRRDTVWLPSIDELVRISCRDSIRADQALLRGSVRDEAGRPVADAAVVVAWQANFKIQVQGSADRISATEETIGGLTNAEGRWRICGAPMNAPVVVRVRTDDGSDARRIRIGETERVRVVDLVPRKVAATIDQVLPKTDRALIELSVQNDTGAFIAGVLLEVELPDGGRRSFTTSATGRALIPDVAPGQIAVRARKIGYRAGQVLATVASGRNTVPIILSEIAAPTLDTVRIVGDQRRATDRHDEFETRRLNGAATRSITRTEIEKRNPVDAWQMLANVQSVKIAQRGGLVIARSMRFGEITSLVGGANKPCYMRVVLDGTLLPENASDEAGNRATDLSQLPLPDQIHGIEVFAGSASIPLQYGGTGSNKWCGLIAVWTR